MFKLILTLFVIILATAIIAPPAAMADVPCQDTSPVIRAVADTSDTPFGPTRHEEEAEERPSEPAVSPGKNPPPSPLATDRIPWTDAAATAAAQPPDPPPPRFFSTV